MQLRVHLYFKAMHEEQWLQMSRLKHGHKPLKQTSLVCLYSNSPRLALLLDKVADCCAETKSQITFNPNKYRVNKFCMEKVGAGTKRISPNLVIHKLKARHPGLVFLNREFGRCTSYMSFRFGTLVSLCCLLT